MNIWEFLLINLLTIFGFNNKPVVDLHKKISLMDKIEAFLLKHAIFFLILSLIILMGLFIGLMFAICGISSVESGAVYNHIGDVL